MTLDAKLRFYFLKNVLKAQKFNYPKRGKIINLFISGLSHSNKVHNKVRSTKIQIYDCFRLVCNKFHTHLNVRTFTTCYAKNYSINEMWRSEGRV